MIPSNDPLELESRAGKINYLEFMVDGIKLAIESELTPQDIESQHKSPLDLVNSLLSKTDLRFLKSFVTPKLYFFYNKSDGCYLQLSRDDLKLLVKNLLEMNTRVRISMKVIESVLKELTFDAKTSLAGYPTFSSKHVVFTNGVINLKTRAFSNFSPKVFCLTKVAFPYDPNARNCPIFMRFLDTFCDGYEDRKKYIRVMIHLIVMSVLGLQVFFYIYGPGASGKSTFIDLLTMLLGERAVHTTTLKALQKDPFEILNLAGKKMNVINDTEDYIQDMSIVKAYTGNDSLRARVMRQNATLEIRAAGFIVAVGNQPLNVKDSGKALARRMRPFKTKNVSSNREPLLERVSYNTWKGPFFEEASAIFNWILDVDKKNYDVVKDLEKHVPSFNELQIEIRNTLNPMIDWIQEEIIGDPGKSTPLGGVATSKRIEELIREKKFFLYPTYINWCKRIGIPSEKPKKFTANFVETCRELKIKIEKIRCENGIVFKGVAINKKVGKDEYQTGDASEVESNDNPKKDPLVSTSEEEPRV